MSKLVDLKKDLKNLRAWDQQQDKEAKKRSVRLLSLTLNELFIVPFSLVREHEAEQIEEHGEKAKEEFPRPTETVESDHSDQGVASWAEGRRPC